MDAAQKAMAVAVMIIRHEDRGGFLRVRLAELDAERTRITEELTENDSVVARLKNEFASLLPPVRGGTERRSHSVIAAVEAAVLGAEGRELDAEDVVTLLDEPADIATIRSCLIRLMEAGKIERPRRGCYRKPERRSLVGEA